MDVRINRELNKQTRRANNVEWTGLIKYKTWINVLVNTTCTSMRNNKAMWTRAKFTQTWVYVEFEKLKFSDMRGGLRPWVNRESDSKPNTESCRRKLSKTAIYDWNCGINIKVERSNNVRRQKWWIESNAYASQTNQKKTPMGCCKLVPHSIRAVSLRIIPTS